MAAVRPRVGAAGHRHRDDQVLGHPHRLVAQPVGHHSGLGPAAGVQPDRARCRPSPPAPPGPPPERGGRGQLGGAGHGVEDDPAGSAAMPGLSASPDHDPGEAALEDDGQLESGQDDVVVDLLCPGPARSPRRSGPRTSARPATPGLVHVAVVRSSPGSVQPFMTHPRSSSGSPTVAISQSTDMAASRAGVPVAEHHVGELVVAVHDARFPPGRACGPGATPRPRRGRAAAGTRTWPRWASQRSTWRSWNPSGFLVSSSPPRARQSTRASRAMPSTQFEAETPAGLEVDPEGGGPGVAHVHGGPAVDHRHEVEAGPDDPGVVA